MTDAVISMTLPAESRFVATVRVTTASLAAELDFTVDEIEELRVGVNELMALAVEWVEDHGGDTVALEFRIEADALHVEASAGGASDSAGEHDSLDVLTAQILSGVVDEHEVLGGWGRITKRRGTA